MNKETIKLIHKELQDAIDEIGKNHGFKRAGGSHITYSDTGFTFKVETLFTEDENGTTIDADRAAFETTCRAQGLSPEDYMKDVRVHGDPKTVYRLIGINPRARKNTAIIQDIKTGKEYVCEPKALDDIKGNLLLKNYHRCGYCGKATYGSNTDELCRDCKETFGHSLFSEL